MRFPHRFRTWATFRLDFGPSPTSQRPETERPRLEAVAHDLDTLRRLVESAPLRDVSDGLKGFLAESLRRLADRLGPTPPDSSFESSEPDPTRIRRFDTSEPSSGWDRSKMNGANGGTKCDRST